MATRRRRRVIFPSMLEKEYEELLERYGASLIAEVQRTITPKKAQEMTAKQLDDALSELSDKLGNIAIPVASAEVIGSKVFVHSLLQMSRVLEAKYGVTRKIRIGNEKKAQILRAWVDYNTNLIVTVPQRFLGKLRTTLYNAKAQSYDIEKITKDLQDTYDQTRFNARRIARDQIGKLHGETLLNGIKAVGGKYYIWRTMGDSKVRESHREMEGKKVSVDSPPASTDYNHAGMAIQCRCYPEIVIEGLEND